jgi:hypothetical protein
MRKTAFESMIDGEQVFVTTAANRRDPIVLWNIMLRFLAPKKGASLGQLRRTICGTQIFPSFRHSLATLGHPETWSRKWYCGQVKNEIMAQVQDWRQWLQGSTPV